MEETRQSVGLGERWDDNFWGEFVAKEHHRLEEHFRSERARSFDDPLAQFLYLASACALYLLRKYMREQAGGEAE